MDGSSSGVALGGKDFPGDRCSEGASGSLELKHMTYPDAPCVPYRAIYAYIEVVWGVNVGIYSIHGVYGIL